MGQRTLQKDQTGIDFDAQFVNTDGTPKDITGNTRVDMEFRKPDNTKVTEATITIIDAVLGKVRYTETTSAKTNIIGAWEYRPVAIFATSTLPGRFIQYIAED